jgi:hypothetical protein
VIVKCSKWLGEGDAQLTVSRSRVPDIREVSVYLLPFKSLNSPLPAVTLIHGKHYRVLTKDLKKAQHKINILSRVPVARCNTNHSRRQGSGRSWFKASPGEIVLKTLSRKYQHRTALMEWIK